MVNKSSFVVYKDPARGYVPALVLRVHQMPEGYEGEPDVALVVFVDQMHLPCYSVARAQHGAEFNQWLYEEPSVKPATIPTPQPAQTKKK